LISVKHQPSSRTVVFVSSSSSALCFSSSLTLFTQLSVVLVVNLKQKMPSKKRSQESSAILNNLSISTCSCRGTRK
ncbi:hypothetical protein T10_12646, partial [Trichinella papuae]